jgi:glycosyltransferase involved in cell wall biosynthesis
MSHDRTAGPADRASIRRVLIVSGIFHPDIGGPATYLRALAETLTKRGDRVQVLTYGDARAPNAYTFPVRRVPRSGRPIARLLTFARTLAQISRDYPLWYVNDYGVPALLVSRVRRPVIVMKIVGDFAWEYSRRHGLTTDGIDDFQIRAYGWRIDALKRLQRAYARSAHRVIVPSRYLAGLVAGWGVSPDRIRVVYNAVSLEGLPRETITPPADGPVLLTAGRLAPWKGMDHLLETVARLRRQLPSVRLVVAGDGPMGEALRTQATSLGLDRAVLWLGGISRERLVAWMEAASLFVLLSEYEGFSHVAIEAMTCGLPVALSRAGGNPELVTDGRDGLLLDPGDHGGSAAALAQLLRDEPRRLAMAAQARARAAEFTWPALIDQTLDVFAEVAPGEVGARPDS